MLELTDKRSSELSTHRGNAAWVPEWLEKLETSPDDRGLLDDGRWALWSDENTWSASFAAAPYLVEIAAMARTEVKVEYVKLLGLMAMYQTRPWVAWGAPRLSGGFGEGFRTSTWASINPGSRPTSHDVE